MVKKILTSFALALSVLLGQTQVADSLKKEVHYYDYSQSRFKVGYSIGQYVFHLSGPEIYMHLKNNGFQTPDEPGNIRIHSIDDRFTPLQTFRGLSIGPEIESGSGMRVELIFTTRKNTSDCKYTYDTGEGTPVIQHHERVRIRYNALTFGYGYKFEKLRRLTVGTNMDIGILRTEKKVLSEDGDGKWYPWFYSFKILGDGIKPNAPVATWGLYFNYDLGPLQFKFNKNFSVLDGGLLSQTNKDSVIPWSEKKFPLSSNTITLSIKI